MVADHSLDVRASWRRTADWRLNGERVQVWERPARRAAAPRLALIHGLEESWTSWTRMAALLPDVHLFGLDLPWRPRSDYRWAEAAAPAGWLGLALELLPETPDLVVAHSFGATALLELLSLTDVPGLSTAALISPLCVPFGAARRDTGEDLSQATEIFRTVMRQGVLL